MAPVIGPFRNRAAVFRAALPAPVARGNVGVPHDAAGIGQADVRVSIADVKKRNHQSF